MTVPHLDLHYQIAAYLAKMPMVAVTKRGQYRWPPPGDDVEHGALEHAVDDYVRQMHGTEEATLRRGIRSLAASAASAATVATSRPDTREIIDALAQALRDHPPARPPARLLVTVSWMLPISEPTHAYTLPGSVLDALRGHPSCGSRHAEVASTDIMLCGVEFARRWCRGQSSLVLDRQLSPFTGLYAQTPVASPEPDFPPFLAVQHA